jgi:hypothetical protein
MSDCGGSRTELFCERTCGGVGLNRDPYAESLAVALRSARAGLGASFFPNHGSVG